MQFAPDRSPIYRQDAAEVCLHQHSDSETTQPLRQLAGRGSDTSLESKGHSSGSGSDRAFGHCSIFGALDCREDVVARDMTASNIVEIPVICFSYKGID